ncbi:MAG: hypothetical protein GKS06_14250 [Acidobacteria bacterium]|nr:hypothetical protein [Acidobacteriota bacterium]
MLKVRLRVVSAWALALLLFFVHLTISPPKLMGDPGWAQRFTEWGYSARVMSGVGMTELLASALLLVPKLAFYGAGMLVVVLGFTGYNIWAEPAGALSSQSNSLAFTMQLFLMAAAVAALRYPEAWGVRPEGSSSAKEADGAD